MQKDSEPSSSSGHMMHNQAVAEQCPVKTFQCSHCVLIFKSKLYLFEHLNKVHGVDLNIALRHAGLKHMNFKINPDGNSNNSGIVFLCQHCDFKSYHQDVWNKHESHCPKKSDNHKAIRSVHLCENPETKITAATTNQHKEGAGANEISSFSPVVSTSKTKCLLNSSNDLKTYKRPLQTITKYFKVAPGSNRKLSVKLSDSPVLPEGTEGTLILQESLPQPPSISSGVFKVTAKSMIDIPNVPDTFLLNDHLLSSDTRFQMQKEESKETVPNTAVKRTNKGSSEIPPAKKVKLSKEDTNAPDNGNTSKQQSSTMNFSFSEDEESIQPSNGAAESPNVYYCKQCDYSSVDVGHMSNHYMNNHPYVRHNSVYIQDQHDQSATFRCLECPVEFLGIAELKRHYADNHPKAPDVFTMQSCDLNLVFKCFLCPYTSNTSIDLEEHYNGLHPTHKVDNSLLYCRYSLTGGRGASSPLITHEKAPSPQKSDSSPESAAVPPREEDKNTPSPQRTASRGTDALYHCNNCNFSHKSVVVMHVHYQKRHPDQPIAIDKMKRSHTASEMEPKQSQDSVKISENCTPEKNTSECLEKAEDKTEPSQQNTSLSLTPKHTPEACKTRSKSPSPKKVESTEHRGRTRKSPTKHEGEVSTEMGNKPFYCQFCSYSSTNIRSVIGHCNAKHAMNGPTSIEDVLCYNAMVQKEKLQSETTASAVTPPSKTCGKEELQHKQDAVGEAHVKTFNAYECAENLFYCQKCNFGNPNLKGVLNHQSKIHRRINSNSERILEHTALMREEIKRSKSQTKESPFATHLPLPIMDEGDENRYFCHFCNYRHSCMEQVIRHYFKSHPGFEVKVKSVRLHTSLLLEQTQKLHRKTAKDKDFSHASLSNIQKKKTKKLVKPFSISVASSVRASQTQRTLKCHRCTYVTQYLYVLRRHMWKVHRSNRSCSELLRVCFKQGSVQSGYHCDVCIFSHKNAATVYKHYQEQHPERKQSLEYISTRLYVGPDSFSSKRAKPQIKCTDGVSPSQRSVETETTYSCKACSFKGSSLASITSHYRAVHPWSVKEDGSVLGARTSKKRTASNQLQNHNEILESFDTYQIPLEFDKSADSSHEAKDPPKEFKCSFCPASFHTQHSLSVHCGMKHQGAVAKTSNQQREKEIQTRVHVFTCPHCNYINNNYQGVLTHCQMKHPSLTARADSLHLDKVLLKSLNDNLKRSCDGLRYRGYMCKACQQVYATVEKLNKHYERCHKPDVSNTLKPVPQPGVSKIQQSNTYSAHGSVSKGSFLHKKIYAVIKCQQCNYSCSTKIALSRHLLLHHRNQSASKVKGSAYQCALCFRLYFRKKHLGSHYIKKHGKDAFFKYCVPAHKRTSVPTAPNRSSTQSPESSSEECESRIVVYKCPTCPYVNASHHGTLTHCQMMHPGIVARADKLQTTEILLTNMVMCTIGKGSNERGFMCNRCPQIYASLAKLKIHSKRDHDGAEPATSKHSDEMETEEQPDLLEADSLKNKLSAMNTSDIDLRQQLGTPETCRPNKLTVQGEEPLYKCHLCSYTGSCRKYLYCHYKFTHKLDALSIYKQLEKYNKRKRKFYAQMGSKSDAHAKCKKCPNLTLDTSQLLIAHYSTFHRSDCKMDFTVLAQRTKRSTGSYKCSHCKKIIHGIKNLSCHLDRHRERRMKKKEATERRASFALNTTLETKPNELSKKDELPLFESVEELAKWNVTPVETFDLPSSPQTSPLKRADLEQPELESRDHKHSCKQCRRTFMSLKGLRSHERSHAALAAIKKLDNLPPAVLKHNINKYILYKSGTLRPFICSICSFRTTVLGLWRSHLMKKHQDVLMEAAETDNQDEKGAQRGDREPPYSTEEMNSFPEPDEEPKVTEKLLYLEPPDVQRQLNQYSLMAQIGVSAKANLQNNMLPENCLLHCEFCNFDSGHLSSIRRHYLNRHGRKMLRCKDCDFFTGIRKTMEMHMATGHSTFQSVPTHQKDLRCPFCLYQTKNKNNMIDHIVLHREERVVPIEVRRSKLSHYLQGIVFRCHKCTFTSGSAENLRLHMMRHSNIKPYRCRLCYFDCTQLDDLEAHLSDKHQVVRNHELVGQVSLDQLEATVYRMPEEEDESSSNLELHNSDRGDAETEDLDTDCDTVLQETLANTVTENYIRKRTTCHVMEAVQMHEQDPREQAGVVIFSGTAGGQGIENDSSGPEEEIQNEYQAQPRQTDTEDETMKLISPKEEATEWSSAESGEIYMPHIQHRALNIKALAEDDISHHIQVLDDNGCKKTTQGKTVKTEQNTEALDNVLGEEQFSGDEGNITARKCKSPVDVETSSGHEIKNARAHESLKVEKELLTSMLSCAQHKISHKGNFRVSFANCKEEVHSQKTSEEDSCGGMPVLENAFLKKEMHPLGRWKEEEKTDYMEPKQDSEEEMVNENRNECKEETARIEEVDNPPVHRGTATEKKLYTCELCGRNLLNSCELMRHVMRHGI